MAQIKISPRRWIETEPLECPHKYGIWMYMNGWETTYQCAPIRGCGEYIYRRYDEPDSYRNYIITSEELHAVSDKANPYYSHPIDERVEMKQKTIQIYRNMEARLGLDKFKFDEKCGLERLEKQQNERQ